MSIMGVKRRRPTLTSVAVAAATLLTTACADSRPTAELQLDSPSEHDAHDEYIHRHSESFRRRLAQTSAEAFANVTTRFARSVPLDLKIDASDPSSPVGYMVGLSGHLEEYAEAFARIGNGEDVNGEYFNSIVEVDAIVEGAEQSLHRGRPERLYYKILEEDGIRPGANPSLRQGLRGRKEGRRVEQAEEAEIAPVIHLNSIEFGSSEELDAAGYREEEMYEAISDRGRSLQVSSASMFANSAFDIEPVGNNRQNRKRNRQKNNNTQNNKQKNKKKNSRNRNNGQNNNSNKKKLPQIDQLAPSKGGVVREKQTFGARVIPSQATGASIEKVTFQLTDNEGQTSGWLDVPKVGSHGFYGITIEGFEEYESARWTYAFQAMDADGRSVSTGSIRFKVVNDAVDSGYDSANSDNGNDGDNSNNEESVEKAPPSPQLMPKTKITDSDWSYGGDVQQSVGRIMFEFDGTDQTFVCSGTVICDGDGGRADTRNGRSIVQTAAHCAYNDQLKKFATRALFIPNQADTKANKSDMDCDNDPMGCWHMSFAVVAKGWTEGTGFPYNVAWDYAYYVVHDDRSTHKQGYKSGLTGMLDRDVPCFNVDFASRRRNVDFVYSLGYSADKDPDYRHCAMDVGTINGIPTYTNLWLEDCAMSGGASGGPWLRDMDRNGRGTLVGTNSWGFTHRDGMASPVLSTQDGSMAECLFEKARRADDPGRQGGIVVNDC